MAGKPTLTPPQLAERLAQLRELEHLTFNEACSQIGVPFGTMRYQMDFVVPRFKKECPDLDWRIPIFSGRGPLPPAVAGNVPRNELDAAESRKMKEGRRLRQP